ncbi:MAG: DNA_ligase_IV_Ku-like, partial [uncultured Gemmatimonadetes bacterium]
AAALVGAAGSAGARAGRARDGPGEARRHRGGRRGDDGGCPPRAVGRRGRQAHRRALPARRALARLAEGEAGAAGGIRHRRMDEPHQPGAQAGRGAPGPVRRRRPAVLRRPHGKGVQRAGAAVAARPAAVAGARIQPVRSQAAPRPGAPLGRPGSRGRDPLLRVDGRRKAARFHLPGPARRQDGRGPAARCEDGGGGCGRWRIGAHRRRAARDGGGGGKRDDRGGRGDAGRRRPRPSRLSGIAVHAWRPAAILREDVALHPSRDARPAAGRRLFPRIARQAPRLPPERAARHAGQSARGNGAGGARAEADAGGRRPGHAPVHHRPRRHLARSLACARSGRGRAGLRGAGPGPHAGRVVQPCRRRRPRGGRGGARRGAAEPAEDLRPLRPSRLRTAAAGNHGARGGCRRRAPGARGGPAGAGAGDGGAVHHRPAAGRRVRGPPDVAPRGQRGGRLRRPRHAGAHRLRAARVERAVRRARPAGLHHRDDARARPRRRRSLGAVVCL